MINLQPEYIPHPPLLENQHTHILTMSESERNRPLNIHEGYPRLMEPHKKFLEKLAEFRANFMQSPVPREVSIEHLAKFFNMKPDALPFSSASDALGSAFDVVTKPGDSVAVIRPAWDVYSSLITSAGDGGRDAVYVDSIAPDNFRQQLADLKAEGKNVTTLVVNNPRNPDMKIFTSEEMSNLIEIANENDMTIIFDEVFAYFDPDADINHNLEKSEAHDLLREIKRKAISSVRIIDTGKIFPYPPFPNIALLDMNEGAMSKGGRKLKTKHGARHFTDLQEDVYNLGMLLNDPSFPQMLQEIKMQAVKNGQHLHATLEHFNFPTEICGPFALVDVSSIGFEPSRLEAALQNLGLNVRASDTFKNQNASSYVRVPILLSDEYAQKCFRELKSKLIRIRAIKHVREWLESARINHPPRE